jgi:hypothetical protein
VLTAKVIIAIKYSVINCVSALVCSMRATVLPADEDAISVLRVGKRLPGNSTSVLRRVYS